MSKKLIKLRHKAYQKQSHRCYYCNCFMWEGTPESYAQKHKISTKTAKRFQCTAEHLLARCDGGKDKKENIVAACTFCNRTRHNRKKQLAPSKYKQMLEKRLKLGKWHPREIHRQGIARRELDI